MDLIGPLHTTKRGNKFIITLKDYSSKWAEAAPLTDKSVDFYVHQSILSCHIRFKH